MPRPKKYPEHKIEAYQLYQEKRNTGEDGSAVAIHVELQEAHPEGTVSYRVIAAWVREFKGMQEWQTLLDSPFHWPESMGTLGLPWEASAYIMDILFRLEQRRKGERSEDNRSKEFNTGARGLTTPRLTGREALWCWRVHLAAPEFGTSVGVKDDVYSLAKEFATREICSLVLHGPFDTVDLEARLVHKSWVDFHHPQIHEHLIMDPVKR